jgi:MFS transporter, MHS family, proline/betaine transporter
LLGSIAGVIVTRLLDPAEVLAWGWRLPFFPGIALGAVAYVMRRRLLEEDYSRVRFAQLPLVEAFQTSWRDIVRGFVAFGVAFYLIFVYLGTYFQQVDKISAARALAINSISMLFLLTITPIAGKLADRFGRRTIMAAGVAGFVVLSWPLFLLLDRPESTAILLGQCGLAALTAPMGARFQQRWWKCIRAAYGAQRYPSPTTHPWGLLAALRPWSRCTSWAPRTVRSRRRFILWRHQRSRSSAYCR